MKPYRTDEYVHKLYYETTRFSAFNQQWVVKAIINNSQRDVHQSNDRQITYQVNSMDGMNDLILDFKQLLSLTGYIEVKDAVSISYPIFRAARSIQ